MNSSSEPLRVYLIDDEALALRRLSRLLTSTGRVEILGTTTDPLEALAFLSTQDVDAVFLDIQMPGLNGFELLNRLSSQPKVVFTTAFDQYALRAFEVNSIDYLLKPVEQEQLHRALNKLEGRRGSSPPPDLRRVIKELAVLSARKETSLRRIPSRIGDRVQFIDPSQVTHFFSRDKLTYASAGSRNYVVDYSLGELEQKLDPDRFVRIHRATLLNLDHVDEVRTGSGSAVVVRLKDGRETELQVARDRIRELRERLGF
jgi:two-component system LytT family response regulator